MTDGHEPTARWRDARGLSLGGKYWGRGWTERWLREASRRQDVRTALGQGVLEDRDRVNARVSNLTRQLDELIVLLDLGSRGEDTTRVRDLAARVNDHVNYLGWLRRQDDDPLEIACAERGVVCDLIGVLRRARYWLGIGGTPASDEGLEVSCQARP